MSIFRTGREVEELKDDLVSARGTIANLRKRIAELEAQADTSAGLIEAAEIAEQVMAEDKANLNYEAGLRTMAILTAKDIAARIRARAADRSGKCTRRQPPLIARILNWACGYRPWDIDEWNEDRREQERQRLDNEEQKLRIELLRRQTGVIGG